MEQRIFFLGDFESNNGPGVANRELRMAYSKKQNCVFSEKRSLAGRCLEMVWGIFRCDTLFICNYTRLHIYGAKLAKALGKRCLYRVHGYQWYEAQINQPGLEKARLEQERKNEQELFEKADKLICVSKLSMDFMKKWEKAYAAKFTYAYNGIDVRRLESLAGQRRANREPCQVLSSGGGMRQKNNRAVCKAIAQLNGSGHQIRYVVVGSPGIDKEEICSYGFVEYHDSVSWEEHMELMRQSQLYVQNSYMETFGIAVIEAALAGCSVLMARNMGVTELFCTLQEPDLIMDNQNLEEIAGKIKNIFQVGNNARLREGMQLEKVERELACELLYQEIVG